MSGMTEATDAATKVPTGIELTALDAAFREDPYPVLRKLAEAEPIHYDAVVKRWVLSDHGDIEDVLKTKASWGADARKALPGTYMALFAPRDGREPSILMLDDPDHARLRGLINKAFTPRAVERLAPRIQEIVDGLLDAVADRDGFDLIAEFSGPLPTIVIAEMLGIDAADQADFKRWSDALGAGFDPAPTPETTQKIVEAGAALDAYLGRAIEERRASPRDDLISGMIAVEEAGQQMTTDEIVIMCGLLLTAGNLTTTDLIGNGALALMQHPDQMAMLRDDPSLVPHAVEEMLRYDSPVVETARVALHDTEVRGCPMKKGESALIFLATANRDPQKYERADEFDITRSDVHHHAFGGGVHFCLGAPLARLEAQIAFATLLKRFPRLRLAPGELEYRGLPAFRGLVRLDVLIS
jgi:cytochrome P450